MQHFVFLLSCLNCTNKVMLQKDVSLSYYYINPDEVFELWQPGAATCPKKIAMEKRFGFCQFTVNYGFKKSYYTFL